MSNNKAPIKMKQSEVKFDKRTVIDRIKKDDNDKITFSFKHLDLNHPDFMPDQCRDGYLEQFLDTLRTLNRETATKFTQVYSRSTRNHQIDWKRVPAKYRNGFQLLPPSLIPFMLDDSWQFAVTKNEHGRVHGVLIRDMALFYVVWLDPNHLCWMPRKK